MKKLINTLLLFIISAFQSYGQQHPQLRLRLGVGKSVVSAGKSQDNTLYRMYDHRSPLPSGIGLEFSSGLNWKNSNLIAGAFLDINPYSVGINPEKFDEVPAGGSTGSSNGSIRFYTGIEKRIGNRKITINRNYFTIFGGLGLSYNSSSDSPDDWFGSSIGNGITKDGKNFKGIYYDGRGNPIFANYFTHIINSRAHVFSPDIFGGLRWNIRNKKGNTVLVAELVVNYGLMPKYYIDVSYTLDGQYQTDRLNERGVSIQLNVLIPLKNFWKKKEMIHPDN